LRITIEIGALVERIEDEELGIPLIRVDAR
jgi:hypothetical protein